MKYLLLILQLSLFATDFDCIVIGSSPFSLFEALYQSHSGKKVLILEEAAVCGGAWQSIHVCGIPHVDLGCHYIGSDMQLKAFLETYAGCKIVSMDHPMAPFDESEPNGWYFSGGCFELIDHLLQLIHTTDIVLYTNCKAEVVSIGSVVIVQTQHRSFSGKKLIVTPMSCIQWEQSPKEFKKSKFYHVYLLIQDPTPFRFTYREGSIHGVSRIMNQTPFLGLAGTGSQLISIQTYKEPVEARIYLDALKGQNLLSPEAYLLKAESHVYETGVLNHSEDREIIEVLQTGQFTDLSAYIPKWELALDKTRSFVVLFSFLVRYCMPIPA